MIACPNILQAAEWQFGKGVLVDLAREWGGFSDAADLWTGTPDARRGQARVLDMLYILGLRHPTLLVVSGDYLDWLLRFWSLEHPMCDGEDLAAALSSCGVLVADWPYSAMSGRAFQLAVQMLEREGSKIIPRLARQEISGAEIDRLFDRAREAGFTPEEMGTMLVDFGGGVFSERHLDRAGFDRVEVAIEAKIAGLWTPGS